MRLMNKFLTSFNTKNLPSIKTDILIIGSGVAGLSAAIQAAKCGEVTIITKDKLSESNTQKAQGGIAVALSKDDSPEGHIEDTLRVGCGLCNEKAVKIIVEEGPARIKELIQWGTEFDRQGDQLSFTREAGHSIRRVIHAKGDATGAELERALISKVKQNTKIKILEYAFVIDLLHRDRTCFGAVVNVKNNEKKIVYAQKVILATGGIGQVYRETTNSPVATGCGMALAYRAGAKLIDMEFVQFHPTTLYVAGLSRTLISEAVRGEGGVLRNKHGERFMFKYHKDGELAPRDVTSRSILKEMRETADTRVYLDLTHLSNKLVKNRFPNIMEVCSSFGIDIKKDFIPVRPTAHYMIGGIKIDENGKTNIQNLYACGETASSGVHGANRLASNSLLEGLVFGYRAGQSAGKDIDCGKRFERTPDISNVLDHIGTKKLDIGDLKASLKSLMTRYVGIERDGAGLLAAQKEINFWSSYVMGKEFSDIRDWEFQNMLLVAGLIQKAALIRKETRGVHYRKDYPMQNDEKWRNTHIELSLKKDCEIAIL
ncbi:L-aspartate oxidase [bacterium]|nr:L-aspartate oxidase [bacterium]